MTASALPKVPQCKYCNETPYHFAHMVSKGLSEGYSLTLVVKASYRLVPGLPLVPMDPQVQFRGDEWIGEDFQGALHHGTDMVLWKPKSDLLLRASCHVPKGQRESRMLASFAVGEWSKAVTVLGDRTWKVGLFERSPGEPQPFTSMPLDWEHAYGGPDFPENPAGKGFRGDLLPNVEYLGQPLRGYGGKLPPASFLPINRMWKKRMSKMGSVDGSYLKKRFPLPPGDFDWTYYNEAPDDQQLDHYLRGDETLRFVNLHPDHPDWITRLPGKRVRCFIADGDEAGSVRIREVVMQCDTLFANVDEGYLHLLWRGFLPIRSENRSEITKMYFVEESIGAPSKSLEEHMAAMEVAQDLGGKMAAQVQAEFAAQKAKVAGILGRYGLEMPADRVGVGPSAQELASFPFNPKGLLPPKLAHFQERLDKAVADRSKALEKLRPFGKEHGVDIDEVPKAAPVDILAMYKKGLQDGIAKLEKEKQEVPAVLREQLAKLDTSDPLGVVESMRKVQKAGIVPPGFGNSLGSALLTGDVKALFAALQVRPRAAPDAPIPGSSASSSAPASAGPHAASTKVGGDPTVLAMATAPEGSVEVDVADNAPIASLVAPPRPPELLTRPAGGLDRDAAMRFLASGRSFKGQNFYAADFAGLDLHGQDLSQAQFVHASLRGANLRGCRISTTLLRHADLRGADLRGSMLGFADYTGADFTEANLEGATFDHASFATCHFVKSNFKGAVFNSVMMDGVDLSGADFRGMTVKEGVWQKCLLHSVRGSGSNWSTILFSECALVDADFSRASVNDSVLMACSAQRLRLVEGQLRGLRAFNGTDLQGAQMVGAHMANTSWMYVRLDEADFSQGDMRGSNLMFSSAVKTRFVKTDLKSAMMRHGRFWSADFRGANLCKASFGHADLTLADLTASNCYQTDFQDANVYNARFEEANLLRSNLRRG